MPDFSLLRAEFHKLRSVPRWVIALIGAAIVTVAFSVFVASTNSMGISGQIATDSEGRPVEDDFRFVHQPLTGDGTVTIRVTSQTAVDDSGDPTDPQPWAKAGVMIKESTTPGSEYAAVLATPEHGIRLHSNFSTDIAGSDAGAPRWLRLTRDGSTITGLESADGRTWDEIGSVTLEDLPETVEAGFFVTSPPELDVERRAGGTSVDAGSTTGVATFDNVSLDGGRDAAWVGDDVGHHPSNGSTEEVGGEFTASGSGDIASIVPPEDVVQLSLVGVMIGALAVIAVSVLFVTSEYRRGMIRTTCLARPRRGAVLGAKAVVAGVATFAIGVVACFAAFFAAYPLLRSNGLEPPFIPEPSLSDPSVLRAILGSATVLALVAVLSVATGMIVRRSAAAIAIVTALFFLPAFLAQGMIPPALADRFVQVTPAGGLAIQRALPPSDLAVDSFAAVGPWAGFGVLCGYVAVALAVAGVLVRRRDV